MSRAGYTAPEALAALAMIGLAIGGLTTSLTLIGAHQSRAQALLTQSTRQREASLQLATLLSQAGALRSDRPERLTGSPQRFQIACGAEVCSAELLDGRLVTTNAAGRARTAPLPSGADPAFEYVTISQVSPTWPPRLEPEEPWQVLRAVTIRARDKGGQTLAWAMAWRHQRYDCEYDPVIEDCRGEAP